jgi:PDZ domain-containing secreted protein
MTPLEQGGVVEITLDVKKPSTVTYNVDKLDTHLVYTATQTLQTGKNIISVDVSEFEEGTYRITVEADKETEAIVFKNTKKKNMRTFADFDDGKKD